MPRVCAVLSCHNNYGRDRVDRHGLPMNDFSWPWLEKKPDRFSAVSRLCCFDTSTSLVNEQKIICSSHFVSKDITGNPTSIQVASNVTLPNENWYKRFETSSLHFFEIDIVCYARPAVFRSVTFQGDLSDPVIYINSVHEVVPCSLISVDDVSKLLRSVCDVQPSVLSHLACAVDSLHRVLFLENAASTCDSAAGNCSQ